MDITVHCPRCGKTLKARAGAAGKQAKCPACGAAFRVPDQSTGSEEPVAQAQSETTVRAAAGQGEIGAINLAERQTAPPCSICHKSVLGHADDEHPVWCLNCGFWLHSACAAKGGFWHGVKCPKCEEPLGESAWVTHCPSCETMVARGGTGYAEECPGCGQPLWLLPVRKIGGKEELYTLAAVLAVGAAFLLPGLLFKETAPGFAAVLIGIGAVVLCAASQYLIVPVWQVLRPTVRGVMGLETKDFQPCSPLSGEFVSLRKADSFENEPMSRRMLLRYGPAFAHGAAAVGGLVLMLVLMAFFGSMQKSCSGQ